MNYIERYHFFELSLKGTEEGNPYKDVKLTATFSEGDERVKVNGFYCGNGTYKVRFMPRKQGHWSGITASSDSALDGIKCEFECTAASENNHGRVLPMDQVYKQTVSAKENRFHFAYEDGTRYQPFGTTCYAWINQEEMIQEETIETLKNEAFNKIRMCIFPKYYTYNTTDPQLYPFEGNREEGFDYSRFNPRFWDMLEKRIAQLDELGIEADIILLHPYDNWGFSKMDFETDCFYLGYAVDRLSHFKNV
ncbi:MAG: DUF5060 domain-containing protein, partial [Eubacteriales bacterium]|nr:DUF5060 domain-containing protein [Eubacteriales bacterium]